MTRTISGLLLIFLLLISSCQQEVRFGDTASRVYLKGYDRTVTGEVLAYHAPQPEAKDALLVRSIDKNLFITWETEPVPLDYQKDTVRFIWMAAIDVNPEQHTFYLRVNDENVLSFRNPADTVPGKWTLRGRDGITLSFRSVMVDKYSDLMGYMFLSLPADKVVPGKPVRLSISGESADSRVWYMTFRFAPQPELHVDSQEAVVRTPQGPMQVVRLELVHLDEPDSVSVMMGKKSKYVSLMPGLNIYRFRVPVVQHKKTIKVKIVQDGKIRSNTSFFQFPVKQKTVYLLPHSHVDIGYTHVQEEVEKIQWENLEKAVTYARKSKDFPEGDRFIWNSEVIWPLETWFAGHDEQQQERMAEAIRNGWIELDGLFANELTGLCRPEELMQLIEPAYQLAQRCKVKLTAAMISDIPGYTQGLITVLGHYGIHYLSVGTNVFDRIGNIINDLGDTPFYWVSPAGNYRVLCWVHGKGYSTFHGGKTFAELLPTPDQNPVFAYLKDLKAKQYPYDMVALRYNIGADNGPPDSTLAKAVKKWNETYVSPRIVISSVSAFFSDFESRYGGTLKERKGDLTPYWSDGAASTALETAINREASENLVRAETAWTMFHPKDHYPTQEVYDAWHDILLYDEHTWGSYNSISEPESDFTRQQWATKRSFAISGENRTQRLLAGAVPSDKKPELFSVVNTLSFRRSGWIELPPSVHHGYTAVTDTGGSSIPTQMLSSGNLLFNTDSVAPFSVKTFTFINAAPTVAQMTLRMDPGTGLLENERLRVRIDIQSGTVRELLDKMSGIQYADTSYGSFMNEYLYVKGRKPDHPLKPGQVTVTAGEDGPLVVSLVVHAEAPGTKGLSREYRIYAGDPHLYISNVLDKELVYDPEGVYFTFPFHLPDGKIHINSAWSVYQPGTGQLPGSCKNYYTVQRWVDYSNQHNGIMMAPRDAPMIELGRITTDANAVGWRVTVCQPEGHIFSYVMNNYWGTNYRAGQEGPVCFRYVLLPHNAYHPEMNEKDALSINQPLLEVPGGVSSPENLFPVPENGIIITSAVVAPDHQGIRLRIYNPSGHSSPLVFTWRSEPTALWYTNPSFDLVNPVAANDVLVPFEVKDILIHPGE